MGIEIFKKVFEFEEVHAFEDRTKAEIIEKLNELQKTADAFEEEVKAKRKRFEEIKGDIPTKVKAIYDTFKLDKERTGLDFDQAFECTEKICSELGESNVDKTEFKDCFAKLDFDGDEEVTLEEMTEYMMDSL